MDCNLEKLAQFFRALPFCFKIVDKKLMKIAICLTFGFLGGFCVQQKVPGRLS